MANNNNGSPNLPHERDESPSDLPIKPQEKMKQAAKDLQRGLVDTDMHGQRGVEEVVKDSVNRPPKKSDKK